MKTDLYTKIVLTFIAAALSVIAGLQLLKLFSPSDVVAQSGGKIQRVAVCSEKGEFCAMVDETSRLFVK
ncbi:MAG: hypothetical protein FJ088_06445 [Deltaproteobacteria bacterium]|nr:hypothetical protein [Deltaproteobacteria bacterium]